MKRFLKFATFLLLTPPTANGFQTNIADYDNISPTLHGFSHPKLSPHFRKTLSLRNIDSRITALEVLTLAGSPWDTCTTSLQKNWGGGNNPNHRRYRIICHELPVFGAFISSHGNENSLDLVQGAIPESGAEFASLEGLIEEQVVRDQMISNPIISKANLLYFYIADEKILVPSYEYFSVDSQSHSWKLIYNGLTGDLLYRERLSLHAFQAYSYLENPFDSELDLVEIENINSPLGQLNGQNFTVYGYDEFSDRATASLDLFDYIPEDVQMFDQVQAYYTLERARGFFDQFFNLDNDKTLTVFTHSFPDNNAMYVPGSDGIPSSIFLGTADNINMQNLNRDSDVLIHEYSHHIVFKYLTTTWGESLTLHEGTADFFAFVINGDPFLGESIIVDQSYLRTAIVDEQRKYDAESSSTGSHLLGEFWSSLLWELYSDMGQDSLKLITNSLNYWPERAIISDAIQGLVLSDQELYAGTSRCKILSLALKKGFYHAISGLSPEDCGLSSAEVAPYIIPLENKSDRKSSDMPACGSIGSASSNTANLLFLMSPLFILYRRFRGETR